MVREDGILCKAATKYTSPFCITMVHTNGTIRIQKSSLSESLNIRRVKPYLPTDPEDTDVEEKSFEGI